MAAEVEWFRSFAKRSESSSKNAPKNVSENKFVAWGN